MAIFYEYISHTWYYWRVITYGITLPYPRGPIVNQSGHTCLIRNPFSAKFLEKWTNPLRALWAIYPLKSVHCSLLWVEYGNNNVGQNALGRLIPRSLMPNFQIVHADSRTVLCIWVEDFVHSITVYNKDFHGTLLYWFDVFSVTIIYSMWGKIPSSKIAG